MRNAEALIAALAMLQRPKLSRMARNSRLPHGVGALLEVAAGDRQALLDAQAATGRPEVLLREAAGFFIEQVLLHPGADSYRVLGGDPSCDTSALRRNMAHLMRWLHPDVLSPGKTSGFDRGIYVNRVTAAWEAIKTGERRAAYDRHLTAMREAARTVPSNLHATPQKRPLLRKISHDDFWSRLLLLIGVDR